MTVVGLLLILSTGWAGGIGQIRVVAGFHQYSRVPEGVVVPLGPGESIWLRPLVPAMHLHV